MNSLIDPIITYISLDNVSSTLNYPSEHAGKVIVLRSGSSIAIQIVIDNGAHIYILGLSIILQLLQLSMPGIVLAKMKIVAGST